MNWLNIALAYLDGVMLLWWFLIGTAQEGE
jgi:hypothetical protein